MPKPLLPAMLALLFTLPAMAQRNFPQRKLYPDPNRPGRMLDSSQIKLLQLRQQFTTKELARIIDSIRRKEPSTPALREAGVNRQRSTTLNSTTLSNSCGTKASFTPANDTVLY